MGLPLTCGVKRFPWKSALHLHRQRSPAAEPETKLVEPLCSSLPSMPWRHFVFPVEVTKPPLAGPSFNSLASPANGAEVEDVDKFQHCTSTVSQWLDALNSESGVLEDEVASASLGVDFVA
ncbi:hypothetical protein T484DRAFT_1883262 [Baffinella frigidus]|nr:hypothetical protein T484DRAFT_1883262 [Cryptophyta sp. CCMP2293]